MIPKSAAPLSGQQKAPDFIPNLAPEKRQEKVSIFGPVLAA
jgi:hypothetical protein